MSISYSDAGVDINAGNEAVKRIKDKVKTTFSPAVLTGIGSFGALFDIKEVLKNYENPVMVQSVDGVGTKSKIAQMMNKYDTVGMDIVNHCSDDILAMGARPITFLDYVASDTLDPQKIEDIVTGMVEACKENNISLIGGETAEMPGVYNPSEHDVVGCISGIVEKNKIITGENIIPGDILLGIASNGLHTNGYSLARKLFFEVGNHSVHSRLPELDCSVGEALLKPHLNYVNPIFGIINASIEIKGLAHITGGGFIENIPRILPSNCAVEIKKGSWPILPIFDIMQKLGNIEEREMYHAFNMGIGMVVVISPENSQTILNLIKNEYGQFKIYQIGKIIEGNKEVVLGF